MKNDEATRKMLAEKVASFLLEMGAPRVEVKVRAEATKAEMDQGIVTVVIGWEPPPALP